MKMAPIKIENWKDFEEMIDEAETKYRKFKKSSIGHVSYPLYRGQGNSAWGLETTLERFLGKNITIKEYLALIRRIKPIIEGCTSKNWQLPELEEAVKKTGESEFIFKPDYKFMAYLRHHQFPSPLLDWTRSPYIAAFFAFNEDRKTDSAIYVYFSSVDGTKRFSSNYPQLVNTIEERGRYIIPDKRHELQQSEYTLCVIGDSAFQRYNCASHERVFSLQENGTGSEVGDIWIGRGQQDIREKYILPYSQRKNFLDKLNQMDINAYFLFANEEGLMHKIAIEELLLKDL